MKKRDERKAGIVVTGFCIDLLGELTLQNRDRLRFRWPALHGLLVRVTVPATPLSTVLESTDTYLLRVGVRLLHSDELRIDVLKGRNLLVRWPLDTAEVFSVPTASGTLNTPQTEHTWPALPALDPAATLHTYHTWPHPSSYLDRTVCALKKMNFFQGLWRSRIPPFLISKLYHSCVPLPSYYCSRLIPAFS